MRQRGPSSSWTIRLEVVFLVALLLGLALAVAPSTRADQTLGRDAGEGASVSPGDVAWADPGNITADDSLYATADFGAAGVSEILKATNYGFSIDSSAVIDGIQVTVGKSGTGDSINDAKVRLIKGGTETGDNKSSADAWPAVQAESNYGGPTDDWNEGWTVADINASDFGVAISASNSGDAVQTASVDYVQVTVFYTLPATIAVNDFASYRVFQRDIGGDSKSVPVSGTYSNMSWARVEARVLEHGTSTQITGWTTIDSTPGGGTFSGNLTVPQGGWYNIEVRALDGSDQVLGTDRGNNKWGVGMIILAIGQSNMSGRGVAPFTAAASDLAVNYSNAGTWEHLADPYDDESPSGAVDQDTGALGSMIPGIANSLVQTFSFPIAFVPAAKGGSNLWVSGTTGWAYRNPSNEFDTSTLYGQSITKAQAVGGVELIIMHQGERDADDNRTEAQYEADFATMISHYRQDLYSTIPIFICQLGKVANGTVSVTDAGISGIRSAQHDLDNGTSIFMGATAMDQPQLADGLHYTTSALTVIGSRLANAIKYKYGHSTYYRGPWIDSAEFTDGNRNQILVALNHRGGTNITPATGITGFEVFDNGSAVTIQSAVRQAADAVLLTLESSVTAGHTVTLRYLYGMTPDVSGLVKDNSPLALPLENTTAAITVAPPQAELPTITNVNPISGSTLGGTSVVITGTNLSGVTSVTFGGTAAALGANTATSITVTTGAHAAGPVNVVVTTPGGTDTATNAYTYVVPAPTITNVNPISGSTLGGTSVVITGTNLSGVTSVTFGGTAAALGANTATSITVTTGAHAAGPVNVVVTTPGGTDTATNAYTYVVPAPTITNVNPISGSTLGGTSVVITGTNLSGVTSVTFGGTAAALGANTATSITVTTGAHAAGPVNVVVTTPGGTDTATNAYTYVVPAPTITNVNPISGSTLGGTSVVITGTNLSGVTSVTFGGTAAALGANTATSITVTTGAHAAGPVNVVVTTPGGTDTATNAYTYIAAPVISSLTPANLPLSGGAITIAGTDFTGASLTIDGAPVTPTINPAGTQITATAPGHTAGPVNVVVTTVGGSDTATLTYVGLPTITGLNPDSGPTTAGTPVVITGTNFVGLTGASAVTFGGTNAQSYTVNSPTQITAVAPAHAAGTVRVQVTTFGSQTTTDTGADDYTYVTAPAITGINPAEPAP